MIDACADKGFDSVEYDNLDSWTRFDETDLAGQVPFGQDEAVAYAELLTDYAHDLGLAVAQKNTLQLGAEISLDVIGFDFAVIEECGVYDECTDYADVFGDHLIIIEYTVEGFETACDTVGDFASVVLARRAGHSTGLGHVRVRRLLRVAPRQRPIGARSHKVARMGDLVKYQAEGSVATITMDDGKVNVLSPAMQADINAALDQAEADGATVILTGRPGRFSAGFDLNTLSGGGRDAVLMLRGGFELSSRLLSFPGRSSSRAPVTPWRWGSSCCSRGTTPSVSTARSSSSPTRWRSDCRCRGPPSQ